MAIHSKKAKEIDVYIDGHKTKCVKGKQKVEINGKIQFLDSYMLPLSLLQYNHDNRRFNLEIQEYETQLGRELNASDREDVKKIKELLLQDATEAKKLKDDLKQLGEQREVAAITHDGIVVNGNRRMATIEQLHDEEPTGKWNELWVVRLPDDISEKDLWKIEAGLQLSKEKVADYGPVNNLLMIREGKKAGLSLSEIAASMYGWTEKQVAADLERLNLIDIFLQFFGQPHNYGLIKRFRLHEHFIDLQKGLVEKLKAAGAPKKEIPSKLEIIFLYLKARITNHLFRFDLIDIRNICDLLTDKETVSVLSYSFDKYNNIKDVPPETLLDNLEKAMDIKKNRESQGKPTKLLYKAIAAIESINLKNQNYKVDGEIVSMLNSLIFSVNKLKTELGIVRQ